MKRKWIIGVAASGVLLLLISLSVDSVPGYGISSKWKKRLLNTLLSDEVPKISVADAYLLEEKVLFLDTRGPNEYAVSHIKNARFVSYEEFDMATIADVPKNQAVIAYCSIGKRSHEIGKKLLAAGYSNVHNLYGGLFEWVNNGLPIVDKQNQPTQRVHAYNKLWGNWLDRGEKVY